MVRFPCTTLPPKNIVSALSEVVLTISEESNLMTLVLLTSPNSFPLDPIEEQSSDVGKAMYKCEMRKPETDM